MQPWTWRNSQKVPSVWENEFKTRKITVKRPQSTRVFKKQIKKHRNMHHWWNCKPAVNLKKGSRPCSYLLDIDRMIPNVAQQQPTKNATYDREFLTYGVLFCFCFCFCFFAITISPRILCINKCILHSTESNNVIYFKKYIWPYY